jgi:hypothetical protein
MKAALQNFVQISGDTLTQRPPRRSFLWSLFLPIRSNRRIRISNTINPLILCYISLYRLYLPLPKDRIGGVKSCVYIELTVNPSGLQRIPLA